MKRHRGFRPGRVRKRSGPGQYQVRARVERFPQRGSDEGLGSLSRDQLGAIDNWEETVPVPVPEGAEYTDLEIDGGAGFMLSMMDEGGAVVWELDGTLHLVAGNLPAEELQQVAESLQ
jgi:hypothetical protein